jgi:hypothetical protein
MVETTVKGSEYEMNDGSMVLRGNVYRNFYVNLQRRKNNFLFYTSRVDECSTWGWHDIHQISHFSSRSAANNKNNKFY